MSSPCSIRDVNSKGTESIRSKGLSSALTDGFDSRARPESACRRRADGFRINSHEDWLISVSRHWGRVTFESVHTTECVHDCADIKWHVR